MNLLEINCQFYRELLQWWAEFRDNFAEDKDWQFIIWNDKEILIDNKLVYYGQYFRSGIISVNDLHFDVDNLTSYNRIAEEIDGSNFLTWTGLRNSVPPNLRQLYSSSTVDVCSTAKPSFKHSKCVFDVTKTKSKHYYALLIGAKARLPNNSTNLKREFNLVEEQLGKIYLLPHTDKLYKIGYTDNRYCSFCSHENETLYHLMFHCPYSRKFWEAFELYFLQVTNQQISLNSQDVLLGVISSKCPLLNYLIIIGKLFLWDCRRNRVLPNITNCLAKVNIKLQTEKYISIKNNTLKEFYDKWNFIYGS